MNLTENGRKEKPAVAGFRKQFNVLNGLATLDLVTVKGAGHFSPLDRPLAVLQLFSNFVHEDRKFEQTLNLKLQPKNLIGEWGVWRC